MKKILFVLIILCRVYCHSQEKDTVYLIFDQKYGEMDKAEYRVPTLNETQEKINISVGYFIRQMEKNSWSDSRFRFSHFIQNKEAYQIFGGKPPSILEKPKSFLKGKKVLDIKFFRTTPYNQVAKTFEAEDSWEQDVIIFMVDVDEIKNDTIVLREVDFSRPVKQ